MNQEAARRLREFLSLRLHEGGSLTLPLSELTYDDAVKVISMYVKSKRWNVEWQPAYLPPKDGKVRVGVLVTRHRGATDNVADVLKRLQQPGDFHVFTVPEPYYQAIRVSASNYGTARQVVLTCNRVPGGLKVTRLAGKPAPEDKPKRESKWRLHEISCIGDSVALYPLGKDHQAIRSAAQSYGKRHGMRLRCSLDGSTMTVTRVA